MIQFIEDHRSDHGVEPICRVLPIAPSTFYDHMAKRADPDLLSDRAKRDEELKPEIERVFEENLSVYGVRKVWHQMRREGFDIARCTVARLMKGIGVEGVVRGKKPKTTIPDKALPCPLDKVNRQFHAPAPNILWVSDFTYVATWQGFVYVAFVIDVFARRIVGWRVSRTATAGFVLDALEQAVHQCQPGAGLTHHSDRGPQYLSIRYTERLAEAGIEPSVGGVGDSYDNALTETINGLFKAEVIHRRGPCARGGCGPIARELEAEFQHTLTQAQEVLDRIVELTEADQGMSALLARLVTTFEGLGLFGAGREILLPLFLAISLELGALFGPALLLRRRL